MLGAESSSVIALRTVRLASGGPAADAEASRMLSEKIAAGLAVAQRAWTGQLGVTMPGIASGVVADFRRTVRANRKRLTSD